jgi:hypothetical protein
MKYLGIGLIGIAALVTGCATPLPQGAFYTDVKLPIAASESASGAKTGVSHSSSYFGMVAIGDSSIEAAKANGGISKVTSVDFEAKNILGIYGKYTTTVRGD